MLLEGAGQAKEHVDVVTGLGSHLGGGPRDDVGKTTWSTVTSTPFVAPHALAHGSNQLSYAGTKWLHCRILSCPAALHGA